MSDVQELLNYDPLADAENQTGKSYKEDNHTTALGILLGMDHNMRLRSALEDNDDTHYGIPFADVIRIFRSEGFEVVAHRPFTSRDGEVEAFIILWNPAGILATMESYDGRTLNSAKIYYNLEVPNGETYSNVVSSGCLYTPAYDEGLYILVGYHDVREGLRHKLGRLRAAGTFLPNWVERPFLWLLCYTDQDEEDYDYEAINESTIAGLPEAVRRAITPQNLED